MAAARLLPRSLFGRLTLILLSGLAFTALLSTSVMLWDRGQTLYQSLRLDLVRRTVAVVRQFDELSPAERERLLPLLCTPESRVRLAPEPLDTPPLEPDAEAAARLVEARLREQLGEDAEIRVALSDVQRLPPGHLRRRLGPGPGPPQAGPFAEPMGPMHAMHRGPPLARYFFLQVRLTDGGWVVFERQVPEDLFDWPVRLLLTLAILVAGVTLLALVAVRGVVGPLRELRQAAEALGKDIHRPPLVIAGPLEVADTARAFNDMQTRLKSYLEDRARILAAVSHDLKTPLTRLRLRLELLDDEGFRAKIQKDLDDMEAMVSATLAFMRGGESREPSQPLDLMALLESLRDDAADAGWTVDLQGRVERPLRGRPLALKRCLGNLLENAVRYGGGAEMAVREDAQGVVLEIRDRGPGIPPGDLERVFEPFVRLEGSRAQHTGGTGLGLSIARNIARAHGGDLVLENRPQGGLVARLTLPR